MRQALQQLSHRSSPFSLKPVAQLYLSSFLKVSSYFPRLAHGKGEPSPEPEGRRWEEKGEHSLGFCCDAEAVLGFKEPPALAFKATALSSFLAQVSFVCRRLCWNMDSLGAIQSPEQSQRRGNDLGHLTVEVPQGVCFSLLGSWLPSSF